jgi:uncharacterized protein (DUF427 family)
VAIGIAASGGVELRSVRSIPHPGRCASADRPAKYRAPAGGSARAEADIEEATVPKATWNRAVIAESDDTVIVEGNHYFPRDSVRADYLRDSDTHTVCPWKGTASYHTLEVDGKTNPDAVWYYPEPKDAAKEITDRVAFWRGVEVTA